MWFSQELQFAALSKYRQGGALLNDLSKAFYCLPHELLIAKLHTYGFDMKSLNLIYGYLLSRKQRVEVGGAYSLWRQLLYGVPQESILRSLLFNVFLCDLFYCLECTDISRYADDITPYNANLTQELVINKLQESSFMIKLQCASFYAPFHNSSN